MTARDELDARMVQSFFVRGIPSPQGSKTAFVVNGKAVMREASRNVKDWRAAVSFVLQDKWRGPMLTGPVTVDALFYMPKPKSARKKDIWPAKRPDIDKLVRAVLDGMTGIAFKDDAQVVNLSAMKKYSDEKLGVWISVCGTEAKQ